MYLVTEFATKCYLSNAKGVQLTFCGDSSLCEEVDESTDALDRPSARALDCFLGVNEELRISGKRSVKTA